VKHCKQQYPAFIDADKFEVMYTLWIEQLILNPQTAPCDITDIGPKLFSDSFKEQNPRITKQKMLSLLVANKLIEPHPFGGYMFIMPKGIATQWPADRATDEQVAIANAMKQHNRVMRTLKSKARQKPPTYPIKSLDKDVVLMLDYQWQWPRYYQVVSIEIGILKDGGPLEVSVELKNVVTKDTCRFPFESLKLYLNRGCLYKPEDRAAVAIIKIMDRRQKKVQV